MHAFVTEGQPSTSVDVPKPGNLMTPLFRAALAAWTIAIGSVAHAQTAEPPVPISATDVQKIVNDAAATIEENYVFADRASEIAKLIRSKGHSGGYASIRTSQELRSQLEADLRSVNGDKHLVVSFSPEASADLDPSIPSKEDLARERRFNSYANNGFVKAERLEGNIGYLDVRGFPKPDSLRRAASAAFGFVSDTDALIIDLRQNGGGWPAGVAWVSSYLFRGRVHLNDLRHRKGDRTEEFWTTPRVKGRKYIDRPVYVLTSKSTFSGGEELAYSLQALKRATVIGEVTAGGAHPTKPFRLDEHFQVWVPFARAVNPITKGNWEGHGVQPDVVVPADAALNRAYLSALRLMRASEKDSVIAADQDRAIAVASEAESKANQK
jgi:hypothetical protein